MCARDLSADEQPQSRSGPVLVAGRTPVGEPLEDGLPLLRGDAGATVDDLDQRLTASLPDVDLDRGAGR